MFETINKNDSKQIEENQYTVVAAKFNNEYKNLDDEIIKPKAKEKLLADKEMAFLSKELATIDKNVPIELNNASKTIF